MKLEAHVSEDKQAYFLIKIYTSVAACILFCKPVLDQGHYIYKITRGYMAGNLTYRMKTVYFL